MSQRQADDPYRELPADTTSPCRGCGASGLHTQTISLFEGQVLPPSWQGDWTQALVCYDCFARQQALLHPVTLMVFRHMQKDKRY